MVNRNATPRPSPHGFAMNSATPTANAVSDSGTRARPTYASAPKPKSSARLRTVAPFGSSGSHSGFQINNATSTAIAAAHRSLRASNPASPAIATATQRRSSTGGVHSQPLTAPGKGLEERKPGG